MRRKQIKEKLMKIPVKYWLAMLFGVLYIICLCLFLFTNPGRILLMIWGFMFLLVGGAIGLFNLWERINYKLENGNNVKEHEEKEEDDEKYKSFEENDDEMIEDAEKNE